MARHAPQIVRIGLLAATAAAALFVPRRQAGTWVGLLMVIGAPSLRMFGALFALPAMLQLRREVALLAAVLIASYTLQGFWIGVGIVVVFYTASTRAPFLLERPVPSGSRPLTADATETSPD